MAGPPQLATSVMITRPTGLPQRPQLTPEQAAQMQRPGMPMSAASAMQPNIHMMQPIQQQAGVPPGPPLGHGPPASMMRAPGITTF